MSTGSGISAQLMMGEESTFGTAVTPNRTFEFNTEDIELNVDRLESAGLRSGKRVQRSDRWAPGKINVAGPLTTELTNKNMGLLFKHIFGGVATSGPNGDGAYTHTFTPADLTGKGLTVQVGRPDVGGTVQPFTYNGMKIKSGELGCKVNEIGLLKLDFDGLNETTATALAVAAYPASLSLMTFVQGTLTIAGSSVNVREASVKFDNGLKLDRFFMGSQVGSEPLEAALRAYTGSLDADFNGLTAYNRFVNGTEAALVLTFTGALIAGASNFKIQVTMNVRFDGKTPTVGGPDLVKQGLPFKCLDTGSGPSTAISLAYITTDVTP